MAVLIIGCGAMGGLYAAHLTRVTQVIAYDTWEEHVQRIDQEGLKLSGPSSGVAKFKATLNPADLKALPIDYAILAVKSTRTRRAIREVRDYLSNPLILSIQNGIGNEEIVAEETDFDICQGVTLNAAEVLEPGHIRQDRVGETWMGPFRAEIKRAQALGKLLNDSGLKTYVMEDVRGAIWAKLIFISTVSTIQVLTGVARAGIPLNEPLFSLAKEVVREGREVAEGLGVKLAFDPLELIEKGPKEAIHKSAMLQDIEWGEETEIDFLSGAIVKRAEELKIKVPINETLYRLVKGLERAKRRR